MICGITPIAFPFTLIDAQEPKQHWLRMRLLQQLGCYLIRKPAILQGRTYWSKTGHFK